MAKKGDWLMAYEKFGSDNAQIAGFGGGVISEDGNVLLSGSADTGEALLFGPAAMREIQSNVANGDFALGPQDPLAAITAEDNPLPYWTVVQTGSAPTISAAIVASATTAGGNALTLTAAASASVGSAFELKRYVPIAGNANRSSAYHPEVFVGTTTGGAADKTRVRITLTATAVDADLNALTVSATANQTASTLTTASLFTNWIVPDAKAAFILLSVKVDVPTTAPAAAVTVPILETRIARSEGAIAFPALQNGSAQPWIIQNENLNFEIFPQTELDPSFTMESNASTGNYNIDLSANNIDGTLNLTGNGWATLSGGITSVLGEFVDIYSDNSVDIEAPSGVNIYSVSPTLGTLNASILDASTLRSDSSATSDLLLQANGADLIFQDLNAADGTNPRIIFRPRTGADHAGLKAGGVGIMQVLSGSSTTTYGQLWAARIYPMNGSTASRYIFDNGTQTAFSGPVLAGAGTFQGAVSADNYTADTITGTTATTNAAIWVLTAGTTYNLRRNTSSMRYKTNIVDVDNAVLEAAKKIRPRHYESTIADENGATRLGFIAEEVEAAGLTHAVGYDVEGRVDTIDATALIAALYARVNDLESRLSELEK
jgi:hypothetical protein